MPGGNTTCSSALLESTHDVMTEPSDRCTPGPPPLPANATPWVSHTGTICIKASITNVAATVSINAASDHVSTPGYPGSLETGTKGVVTVLATVEVVLSSPPSTHMHTIADSKKHGSNCPWLPDLAPPTCTSSTLRPITS